jgi:hypothetical protein
VEGLDDDALAKSLATARSRHASESIFDIDTPQGRVRLKVTNLMVVEIVDNNIGVIDPGGQSCQFCSSTGRLSPRRPNVDLNRRDSGAKRDSQPPASSKRTDVNSLRGQRRVPKSSLLVPEEAHAMRQKT